MSDDVLTPQGACVPCNVSVPSTAVRGSFFYVRVPRFGDQIRETWLRERAASIAVLGAQRRERTMVPSPLDVANPDEEWRWTPTLGNHRSCDNCTHVLAHKADATVVPGRFG